MVRDMAVSPGGCLPKRMEGQARAVRPGIEADVAHQAGRQIARHAAQDAVAVPG
ncbi:hypothetical protein ACFOHS_02605 [Jhaorihella thermophila]